MTQGRTEHWHWNDNSGFDRVAVDAGLSLDVGQDDLDWLDVRIGDGACAGCKGYLPRTFRFCPMCGAPLRPLIDPATPLWCSMSGGDEGLATVATGFRVDEKQGAIDFELPGKRDAYAFAAAGKPRRPIAIDRERGETFVYSSSLRRWRPPSLALSHPSYYNELRFAWRVAATDQGAAYPSDGAPLWLDLTGEAPRLIPAKSENCGLWRGVRCLAGAIAIDDVIYLPVTTPEQPMAMACKPKSEPWSLSTAIDLGSLSPDQPVKLAAPVSSGRHAFWPSEHGFLALNRTADGPVMNYRPWRDRGTALLLLRPSRDIDSDLYQPVWVGDSCVYQSLVAGDGPIQSHEAEGPCISAGDRHFRRFERLPKPWEESPLRGTGGIVPLLDSPRVGSVVLQLYRLDDWADLIAEKTDAEQPPEADLCWRSETGRITALRKRLFLSSLDDVQVFVFNQRLYAYHASKVRAWSWPIRWLVGS
ncbi:MAG TPA: zinc ribbon domain-containing protein, partial [Candidatus Defluviicoccus seviourii]|nr:zinc ribbon domain-containing protein [Candidatus Defluviicoccus seviourii]